MGALGVAKEMQAANEEGLVSEWYILALQSLSKKDGKVYDPLPFEAFEATERKTFKRDGGELLEVRVYKITAPNSLVVHEDAFPPEASKRGLLVSWSTMMPLLCLLLLILLLPLLLPLLLRFLLLLL